MYGYAASSSAASTLRRFSEPPQTTNAAGQSDQIAAVTQAVGTSTAGHSQTTLSRLMSAVPQQLQTLASGGATTAAADPPADPSVLTAFSNFNTLTAPINLADGISRTYTSGGSYGYAVKRDVEEHSGPAPEIPPGPPLSVPPASAVWPQSLEADARGQVVASVGRAAPIGGLSVPQSWASATPVASVVENPQWLSEADLAAAPSLEHSGATNMFGGVPATGAGTRSGVLSGPSVHNVLRVTPRPFTMPRPSLGG